MKKFAGILAIAMLVSVSGQNLFAQGWGKITGRIVVDGKAPVYPALVKKGDNAVKDAAVCAANNVSDASFVVGEKGGVANCFVYLYQRRGTPEIHPNLEKPAKEKLTFNNQGCDFKPHAMVVRVDQKVNCINSDGCGHNVHTFPLRNGGMNEMIAANNKVGIDAEFTQGEPLPMSVVCDIHPWMTAKWFVVTHPYAIVTDEKGNFTIDLIPAGKHKFRIWHEIPGYLKKDGKRDIQLTIVDGKTIDLGDIKIPAATFQKK